MNVVITKPGRDHQTSAEPAGSASGQRPSIRRPWTVSPQTAGDPNGITARGATDTGSIALAPHIPRQFCLPVSSRLQKRANTSARSSSAQASLTRRATQSACHAQQYSASMAGRLLRPPPHAEAASREGAEGTAPLRLRPLITQILSAKQNVSTLANLHDPTRRLKLESKSEPNAGETVGASTFVTVTGAEPESAAPIRPPHTSTPRIAAPAPTPYNSAHCGCNSMAECRLSKPDVVGSTPITRFG